MTMTYPKKLKYLQPLTTLVLIGLWFLFSYLVESRYSWTILIPMFLDFALRYGFYKKVRQKELNKDLLFVKHKRWYDVLGLHIVFGFLLVVFILFGIFVTKDFSGMVGLLIPGYILVHGNFFYNGFDGYFLTENGIQQLGPFDKDYPWKDVEDILITEKALHITINSKELTTKIEKGVANRVMDYLSFRNIGFRS